jgi:TonB family protein
MNPVIVMVIRSSAVLALGLAIVACLGRRSAALRHCVLAAAIAGGALVAPFSLVLPAWDVPLPATSLPAAAPAARMVDTHVPISSTPALSRAARVAPQAPATPSRSPMLILWLAGFLVTLSALLSGVARLRRIAGRAARVTDTGWIRVAQDVRASYGITRAVVLLQTDAPDLLATWGILRPRVLLPADAREWPEDRVRVVLNHELAHIRRHDWFVQMAAETLRTVLWFNPLIWIACTRLRREGEQACDDAVLEKGVPAREYASHLLDLARKLRRPSPWLTAMPMAHPSTLERRIAAMLNPRLDRQALSRRAIAATAALVLAVTLPIAALRGAQTAPASLSGTIYDVSGAVMPGVEITLEDANQFKWSATTSATGRFEFTRVQPGRYVLAAAVPGFKTLKNEFELKNARDWDRAITLQVGDLRESITVRESRLAAPAAPSQQGPQPVRVGGNIRAPRKELDVRPVYPTSMRAAGREGVVPIEAIIGRDGTVTSVRVLTAQVHPDFAIAAVDAVRQWRFSPTLLNGAPVEVVMTVSVTFNLSD